MRISYLPILAVGLVAALALSRMHPPRTNAETRAPGVQAPAVASANALQTSSDCRLSWVSEPLPDVGTAPYRFEGVVATSVDSAWVVGDMSLGTAAPQQLIEHWDDAAWSLVSMPDVDSPSALYAVSASSGSDVWAVGSAGNNTLIEHWDGSAWSRVPSPNGDGQSQLLSVDALASNDVWADGFSIASGSGSEPLLLHWDGVSWNAVPNTQPSLQNLFTGISGSQSDDVWAVGSAYYPPSNSEVQLAERWNGVDWEVVRGPGSQTVLGVLNDVVALSPSDVWVAVSTGGPRFGAVLHWDGSTLTQVNLPWSAGKLAASSANDVWAAGSGLQHWDGNEWRTVIAGYPGDEPNYGFTGISVFANQSSYEVWAVGHSFIESGPSTPIILHRCAAGPVVYDVNCDGAVDGRDALRILDEVDAIPAPSDCGNSLDVDCDGGTTPLDAIWVLKYLAGLAMSSPCPAS